MVPLHISHIFDPPKYPGKRSDKKNPFVTPTTTLLPNTHSPSFVSAGRALVLFWEATGLALRKHPLSQPTPGAGMTTYTVLADETSVEICWALGSLLLFPKRGINLGPAPLSLPLYLERDRMSAAAGTTEKQ